MKEREKRACLCMHMHVFLRVGVLVCASMLVVLDSKEPIFY